MSSPPAHRSTVPVWPGVLGTALLTASSLVLVALGSPPRAAAEVTAWADQGRAIVFLTTETGIFATVLVLAQLLLIARRGGLHLASAHIALAALTLATIVRVLPAMALGRLIYPVFDLPTTPGAASAFTQITYGAQHVAVLMEAAAMFVVGVALLQRRLAALGLLSLAAGTVTAAGAFPWALPPAVSVASALATATWLLTVLALLRRRR